jgi:replicative DNA helicase
MAYSAELEVLYHLTHDPDRTRWEQFTATFKGVNPFEVAQGVLFELIKKYRAEDKMPGYGVLEHEVKSADTGPAFAARIAIDELRGYHGDPALFPTALLTLKERWIERTTLASTKIAQEIVVTGYKVGRDELKGTEAAWQFLQERRQKIADIRDTAEGSGNLYDNMDATLDRYTKLKENRGPNGEVPGRMSTGIRKLDILTSGLAGGEFWIIGAYAGEGKSTMMRNMAYNLAVRQHKNVVYATAEMTKQQIETMLISRHSYNLFGADNAVPFRGIRDGSLTPEQEETLRSTTADLKDGFRAGKYGLLDILQVPGRMTVPDLGDYLATKNREHHIDAVFLDYALLFASHIKTNELHESYAHRIRACKMMALNFGTRDQLAVVTAHQLNRVSRDEAEIAMKPKKRHGAEQVAPEEVVPYSMRALAGTAEAEKSADVAMWILLRETYKQSNFVRAGLVKNREGETGKPFNIKTDFKCSFMGNDEWGEIPT